MCLLLTADGLLLTNGCAYVPLRGARRPAPPLPAEVSTYYSYPRQPVDATLQLVQESRGVREYLAQFPLRTSGFEPTEPVVEFEWFESGRSGRRPAVLFNPILGGDYPLERDVCRYLARRGFHVALVHRKAVKIAPEHEPARLELLLRQGVLRVRQIVDWMAANDRVDAQRMGSFGISMGGMASVMAAAVEPRLRAHVVALAGGSIPDILMTSKDRLLTKPLARYLQRNGMDRATLEAELRQEVRTDPLRLAPYVDPHQVFLFIAIGDRTIGVCNALRLRRALREPRTVFVPLGHYTAYLILPYLRWAGAKFLEAALAPAS